MCRTIKVLISNSDLGRENSASCYRQGKQLLLTFLTMVTRWLHSTSNLYALIGQLRRDVIGRLSVKSSIVSQIVSSPVVLSYLVLLDLVNKSFVRRW